MFQQTFMNSEFMRENGLSLVGGGDNTLPILSLGSPHTKGIVYELKGNSSKGKKYVSVNRLNQFVAQFNSFVKDIGATYGEGSIKYKAISEILERFDKLVESLKGVETIDSPGGRKGEKVFKVTANKRNQIERLIASYQKTVRDNGLSQNFTLQGDAGELVIAAINVLFQNVSGKAMLDTLSELLQDTSSENGKAVLGWVGKEKVPNATVVLDERMFLRDYAAKIANSNKKAIENVKARQQYINKFSGLMDKDENFVEVSGFKYEKSYGTADVLINIPKLGLEDLGASVKNYRRGINAKEIHLVNGVNLLSLLDLMTTSYFAHFMHVSSRLYEDYPDPNHPEATKASNANIPFWRQTVDGLKYAALVRGLAGLRGRGITGGTASLFILIDHESKKVRVYDIYRLITNLFDRRRLVGVLFDKGKAEGGGKQIVLENDSGTNLLSLPSPIIYENNFVTSLSREQAGKAGYKGSRVRQAAKARSTEFLMELHRRNLIVSLSINPSSVLKNSGK